jgi:dipeptidyl-peptidase-4
MSLTRFCRYAFPVFFFLGFLTVTQAQNKQLTIEDAQLNKALQPKNLSGLAWRKGTHNFTWIEKTPKGSVLVQSGVGASTAVDTIIRKQNINTALQSFNEHGSLDPLDDLPFLTWYNSDAAYFTYALKNNIDSQLVFLYYPDKSQVELLGGMHESGTDNLDVAPMKKGIAYTYGGLLFVSRPGIGGKKIQIGGNETENNAVVYGQKVHREEFGITKGTFWSPQGNKLAFYRMDQSMVTDYPIVDLTQRPAKEAPIKYPMAGMKSHQVTLGVLDMNTEKIIYLKTTGDPEQYLTNISWSPDEKYIYIAVLNRSQNHMWLNKYDAATGDFVKTLFEETHEKYVEPLTPLYFLPGKPNEFLWLSQRDGWMHFYHYNTEGKLLGQVTKGNWIVTDFLGFDEKGKTVYFNATKESPIQINAYSVAIKGSTVKRLTATEGVHFTQLSEDGKYLIDNYSNTSLPREIDIVNTGIVKVDHTLLKADNPVKDYALGETKVFSIKANDGTELYCRLITPPNMAQGKKYPVIVYVYGGPHAQMVTNTWLGGSNLWMQYLAQHGYIVFTLDNRGSKNRGRAFEQSTFRNLGTIELDDQMAGVDYLRSLPFVDTARMGVHGWSYGGFMTTSLMLKRPGVFKVAVAGGPVIDWKYYEVMYTERYMDTPLENPAGYWNADLTNHVKNLNGRLLIIHGTSDPTVVWQHSLMFVKKCVDEKKQIDYMVYPGHEHNVLGPDRVHLLTKITQYFDDFLK